MFWLIILLLLLALVLYGLANQRQAANKAAQTEKEIIAFAAGLRRRNQSYAAIADAELLVAVMERLKAHQRPVFLLWLGSGLMLVVGIATLHATAPRPSVGEFALAALGFASSAALIVWSIVNTIRNMKKPSLQSTVEETLERLSAEIE